VNVVLGEPVGIDAELLRVGAHPRVRSLRGLLHDLADLAGHLEAALAFHPVGFDEQRWTLGLNYWLTPSAVIKAAYEFDDKNGGARDQDAFMMQVAVGF